MKLFSVFLMLYATHAANKFALDSDGEIRGVAPKDYSKYKPNKEGLFQCLDGKKKISFDRVNDDYCDCEDGSDEPGTSACNNSKFYCKNVGHIPVYIGSERVNDGVCDEECCDGSDEWSGITKCENRCKELGEVAKKKEKEQKEIYYMGGLEKERLKRKAKRMHLQLSKDMEAKIKEKGPLEKEVSELEKEKSTLETKEREIVSKLTESSLKMKQELYDKYKETAVSFRRFNLDKKNIMEGRVTALVGLLKDLAKDYNKEYDDKAVEKAIADYNKLLDMSFRVRLASNKGADDHPDIEDDNTRRIEEDSFTSSEAAANRYKYDAGELADDLKKLSEILAELENNYNRNYHDLAVKGATNEFLSLKKTWSESETSEAKKEAEAEKWDKTLQDATKKLIEIDQKSDKSSLPPEEDKIMKQLEKVKSDYYAKSSELSSINNNISSINETLLFDLGPDNIFLALKDQCVSIELSEYKYEVCFLGSATQIGIKDYANMNLGKFTKYGSIKTASGEEQIDYKKLSYLNGAHCWNGPARSLHVNLECGKETLVLSVMEPEKCEYHMKMKLPAVCPDLVGEQLQNAIKILDSEPIPDDTEKSVVNEAKTSSTEDVDLLEELVEDIGGDVVHDEL
ncbi:hypothetical protein BB559_001649 [Furculomyces boomerangus]|uniref:Glucosidase 2 subunit beta n=1 Tax=Furculomyces boomerangus TaxID=61424 RepID=A0A2T9Z1B9_9FUNG|nr:hypothetical protein BB559_001649 [Furculomyces boomerangus]